MLTVDWDGQAAGNQSVEVVFYQRDWNRIRDEQYSIYYTRWEPVDTEVDRGASHNKRARQSQRQLCTRQKAARIWP